MVVVGCGMEGQQSMRQFLTSNNVSTAMWRLHSHPSPEPKKVHPEVPAQGGIEAGEVGGNRGGSVEPPWGAGR